MQFITSPSSSIVISGVHRIISFMLMYVVSLYSFILSLSSSSFSSSNICFYNTSPLVAAFILFVPLVISCYLYCLSSFIMFFFSLYFLQLVILDEGLNPSSSSYFHSFDRYFMVVFLNSSLSPSSSA